MAQGSKFRKREAHGADQELQALCLASDDKTLVTLDEGGGLVVWHWEKGLMYRRRSLVVGQGRDLVIGDGVGWLDTGRGVQVVDWEKGLLARQSEEETVGMARLRDREGVVQVVRLRAEGYQVVLREGRDLRIGWRQSIYEQVFEEQFRLESISIDEHD